MVGQVRFLAIFSALAAASWLLCGAQMIVTADDHAAALGGLGVCLGGLLLAWLSAELMMREPR